LILITRTRYPLETGLQVDMAHALDPSAAHSFGWNVQDDNVKKELIQPNLNAPPPTLEECKVFRATLARVQRFYSEGEDKQGYQMTEIKKEREHFQTQEQRINIQLDDLKKFPESHTRRKLMEKELQDESKRVAREIRARDAAQKKMEIFYVKRAELVQTMKYLNTILDSHCTKLETTASTNPKSS